MPSDLDWFLTGGNTLDQNIIAITYNHWHGGTEGDAWRLSDYQFGNVNSEWFYGSIVGYALV